MCVLQFSKLALQPTILSGGKKKLFEQVAKLKTGNRHSEQGERGVANNRHNGAPPQTNSRDLDENTQTARSERHQNGRCNFLFYPQVRISALPPFYLSRFLPDFTNRRFPATGISRSPPLLQGFEQHTVGRTSGRPTFAAGKRSQFKRQVQNRFVRKLSTTREPPLNPPYPIISTFHLEVFDAMHC